MTPPRLNKKQRSALVYWLERWRMLMPSQQSSVFAALERADRDAMRRAQQAKKTGDMPEPFGRFARERAIRHASNAGAANIAQGLLRAAGCLP